MSVIVVGDSHSARVPLNRVLRDNEGLIEMVLHCGDIGYFPRLKDFPPITDFGHRDVPMYFCEGNHDDHETLRGLGDNHEVARNIFFMKRGSILVLPDGRSVLFMGGASSWDWKYRTEGVDYFPKLEYITEADLVNLPASQVDIVISHTAPLFFDVVGDRGDPYDNVGRYYDPSRKALNVVFEQYKPERWYFGHFHTYQTGFYKGCHWTALADTSSFWTWVEELAEPIRG